MARWLRPRRRLRFAAAPRQQPCGGRYHQRHSEPHCFPHRGLKLFDEVAGAEHFEHVEDDPGGMPPHRSYCWPRATANLLTELARDAGELPRYCPPRYYSQRLMNRADPVLGLPELKAAFGREVHRLAATGYFEDAFASACIDVREDDRNEAGQRRLAEAVSSDRALWPVRGPDHSDSEQTWTEELFYDVVEALHDRVADKLALNEILREHGVAP